jgi:hypothetical protein
MLFRQGAIAGKFQKKTFEDSETISNLKLRASYVLQVIHRLLLPIISYSVFMPLVMGKL